MPKAVTKNVTAITKDRTAEACLACGNRPLECRPRRNQRDHARDRQVQDLCQALAGALHAGRYGVPDNVFRQFTHSEQAWLREQLESDSKHILNVARKRARDVGAATIFLESRAGDVANTIIEIAQEKDVGNIVVGKRGVGRVAAVLLGSVSQKVVSLASKPVTVVP